MNPIISSLIELMRQGLVDIKQESTHHYSVEVSDSLNVAVYSHPYCRIWDSKSKSYTTINKSDFNAFTKSIERKYENAVLLEMRKVLESGQARILEDGIAMTNTVINKLV